MVPWAHACLPSKWHLDQFSQFAGLAGVPGRKDTQTHKPHHITTFVATARIPCDACAVG